jgi:hypothetical protein
MNPFTQFREEFIEDILGITNPFFSNAIIVLLLLAFVLFIVYTIKLIRDVKKLKEEDKEKGRKTDKMWMSILKKEDKDKK